MTDAQFLGSGLVHHPQCRDACRRRVGTSDRSDPSILTGRIGRGRRPVIGLTAGGEDCHARISLLNWLIMLGSIAGLLWLGWKSSATVHAGGDDESGFLIAGRSLGPFVGAATIVATGYSGWGFMGSPGVAYQYGAIELLGNFMFAPAMVIAVLFFARFLSKRAEEMHSCTIPEYAARTHADGMLGRWVQGVAAIMTIVLLLVFLTSQIKAVGILAAGWLDLPEAWGATTLMIAIIIIYTVAGGLLAVAWTDALMLVGMVIAAIIICIQIFGDIGPLQLVAALNDIQPVLVNPATAPRSPMARRRRRCSWFCPMRSCSRRCCLIWRYAFWRSGRM
ncbi:sodium:solute symporter family protein [Paracoccus homiensis]|uniref:sodium:solute symporter family protein n=1 Tax=Paracoccus homiensis TaxID=364199 RepID=UPI00398D2A80